MEVSGRYNNIKGNQTHTTFKYKAPNYLSIHVFSIEYRHSKGRYEKWYYRLDSCFKLRIRKAVFVGHSMRGYVALAFA
jgi:pimeloyl-ACP methyl ester carboxylesterase